jgi:hypothetical protein
MKTLQFLQLIVIFSCNLSIAQDAKDTKGEPIEELSFKTEWKGERIKLPPGFAPEMKLKGIEEIRFAPGMFKPESGSFFSYVFVFAVPGDSKLTKEVIEEEMLAYYRGLAGSILKRKGKEVDVGEFGFRMDKAESVESTPTSVKSESIAQYIGKLDWVEPFTTLEPQILHFELQSWSDSRTGKNYLFVCTSPKAVDGKNGIWKELRKIRRNFEVKSVDGKKN